MSDRFVSVYCRYFPNTAQCKAIAATARTTSTVRTSSVVATSSSVTRPTTTTTTTRTTSTSSTRTTSTSSTRTTSTSSTRSTTSTSSSSSRSSSTTTSSSSSRSSSTTSSSTSSSATASASALAAGNAKADILVIARDQVTANNLASGFNGYGIPYSTLVVPQAGTTLPALNTSGVGNYGGIVIHGQVSYDFGAAGFQSALTADQWNQLYAYQLSFGARMVHLDVYPGPLFGATAIGGCCALTDDQPFVFTNTAAFAQAGLKTNAPISTKGLYHYGATITDANTTEIGSWVGNSILAKSTGAVINNFAGRQQMAFFTGWAPEFSTASNIMQHAYITWITRGLYAGFRRVNLNTQIDDVFLVTDIYKPTNGATFRTRVGDMTAHAAWVPTINAKMNPGSFYRPEMGHNGNGNIEASTGSGTKNEAVCAPGPIYYDEIIDTPLEFQKPLGTGKNFWPTTPTTYGFSQACLALDDLHNWMVVPANRDNFAHMSHTFTHEELNNATYSDAIKEIQFNQAWLQATGLSGASYFSGKGLIPPAITGLHNGDVLSAWTAAGLTNCVGDNTRVPLRNAQNPMWPYFTTVADNGFAGFQVNPRWATRIYYNCDSADCTASEWVATSTPVPSPGTFDNLMATEVNDNMRHFFGLYREGYMFHQANLRQTDAATITVNGTPQKLSIFQAWVETMVFEFNRLANWPMITLKHDDMSASFLARFKRDACKYKLSFIQSGTSITGVQVSSETNSCSEPIPVTFPTANKPTTTPAGATTEQVGNDPYTVWVKLTGAPVTITLATPLAW